MSEQTEPICQTCGEPYSLDEPDFDPTPNCTPCAHKRVEELTAENAELRKDAARLDWVMHKVSGKELRRINVWLSSGGSCWTRAAIDSAMEGGL